MREAERVSKPPKIHIRYIVVCEGPDCGTDGECYNYAWLAREAAAEHRAMHREGEFD